MSVYDEDRSCRCGLRSAHISCFHLFFNIALQFVVPIDQNYVFFVDVLLLIMLSFYISTCNVFFIYFERRWDKVSPAEINRVMLIRNETPVS